jgi:hypothetical protein
MMTGSPAFLKRRRPEKQSAFRRNSILDIERRSRDGGRRYAFPPYAFSFTYA